MADAGANCIGSGECMHLNDKGLQDALLYLLVVDCLLMFKNS